MSYSQHLLEIGETEVRRVEFNFGPGEDFLFEVDGVAHRFGHCSILAQKGRLATNIREYVLELPKDAHKVYLTVVGEEDQDHELGVFRGWYVAERLADEEAAKEVELLAKFTAEHGRKSVS